MTETEKLKKENNYLLEENIKQHEEINRLKDKINDLNDYPLTLLNLFKEDNYPSFTWTCKLDHQVFLGFEDIFKKEKIYV